MFSKIFEKHIKFIIFEILIIKLKKIYKTCDKKNKKQETKNNKKIWQVNTDCEKFVVKKHEHATNIKKNR